MPEQRTGLVLFLKPTPRPLLVVECADDKEAIKFFNDVASKAYNHMELVSLMTPAEYIER